MAGKYRTYSEYKSAESKWLDVIPKHWSRSPLKNLVLIRITDGPHETPEFVDDGIPFLSAEAVKNNALDFSKKRGYITKSLHELYSKKCLPKINDIFMVKSGNTTGALAIVETDDEFNIWSPLALIRANKIKVIPRFIFYSMQSEFFQTSVQLTWSQGTQPNIGMGVIENLHIAIAPLEEQGCIVNFLDHETAKIDTLIEKQQQLIKLLKEKRQAVISHAVTKGLNPNAKMRDSGVECIGDIPESWIMKSLSIASKRISVGLATSVTEYYRDEGVPIIRNLNIKEGCFDGSDMLYLDEKFATLQASKVVCKGDVIVVRTGSNVGLACVVPDKFDHCHTFTTLIVTTGDELLNGYLVYCINSDYGKAEVERLKFGFGKDNLNVKEFKCFYTLIPSSQEQIEIVNFLDHQIVKIDDLVKKAYEAINLIQERRTALISAAVTGKIDVRDWQPSNG